MNDIIFPIYIGYDSREDIAYRVCEYSILKHSTNVEVKPLIQSELKQNGFYNRDVDQLSSTEFTFTRFLVPALQNYNGWALFCDCDFVWDGDISELFEQIDHKYAVMVVKHDHRPKNTEKMDGKTQTQYPRKNWSSCILWNCGHKANKNLTVDMVNTESGKFLHRFQWLEDKDIGELKPKYNFLVGWNDEEKDGKPLAYHWTEGGPWFENYANCPYNHIWIKYLIEYANQLGRDTAYSKPSITWVTSLSKDYYNNVGIHTLHTWKNLPGEVVFVWDDKPQNLGFGKTFNFYKDVVSPNDPWLSESMGGPKADRFWKKSRVQIWASRRFSGLVVWIDADMSVVKPLTLSNAIDLLHPKNLVWSSLDCGSDWDLPNDCPIDTGIVVFNTKHDQFHSFIKDYSLTWYNGDIYKLPQPYDHHAANHVRAKWPMMSLVPHFSTWANPATEFISRYAMDNSVLKEYFIHHLGIANKERLNREKE